MLGYLLVQCVSMSIVVFHSSSHVCASLELKVVLKSSKILIQVLSYLNDFLENSDEKSKLSKFLKKYQLKKWLTTQGLL